MVDDELPFPRVATPPRSEVQAWAYSVVTDSKVKHQILVSARKGQLNPRILQLLFYYAYGRPEEAIRVRTPGEEEGEFVVKLVEYKAGGDA
jgi:hypothetical protein